MQSLLRPCAYSFALAGGAFATATALLTGASIIGRSWFAKPIPGDVELVQFAIAVCISLCLPWCQLKGANIIVDFFTQGLRQRATRALDAFGALLLSLMCLLLAWRTGVGAAAVYQAQETTMILGLPGWWSYAFLAPGLALAAAVALWQASRLVRGLDVTLDAAPQQPV